MTDILDRLRAATEGATEGRWVQFHPRYCPEAKGTPFSDWDSSHDMSAIRADDGTRYKLATFRHASDAFFAQEARRLLPAMRDALRAAVAPAVRVKPLVWLEHPNSLSTIDECAVADAPFSHRYQVQRDPWGPGYMAFLYARLPIVDSTLWWESKGHATIEAAKAAALADRDARILSALDTAPEGQP